MLVFGETVLDKFMGVADSIILPYQMVMCSPIRHDNDYFAHYIAYDGSDIHKIKGVYLHPFLWSDYNGRYPSIDATIGDLIYCKEACYDD